ncbi:MAG: TIGR02147 family protein [Chitinispirillaceae bacterium]|nr:TIGR02147 family protein [Chitinispirillaceae bacterium]
MINIFEYQNYRLYLKDYYNEQKSTKKYFSYRYFSKKAGINASAFLYYVIEGKRNLTKSSIEKISSTIGHSKEENDYFENLVFFNQGKTIAEKAMYYSRIVECRKPLDIKTIDKDQYEFYSKWYHSIVREIACMIDFKDDYAVLGSYLVPAIGAKEAQASIDLLERIGLLERDENGLYHQTDAVIGVKPAGHDAFVIEKFQLEMLDLSRKSFDEVPRSERLSASTTFSISKATFELFKMKTREFRKELLEIAKLDNEPDRVYQFTFNLFPATRSIDDEKR